MRVRRRKAAGDGRLAAERADAECQPDQPGEYRHEQRRGNDEHPQPQRHGVGAARGQPDNDDAPQGDEAEDDERCRDVLEDAGSEGTKRPHRPRVVTGAGRPNAPLCALAWPIRALLAGLARPAPPASASVSRLEQEQHRDRPSPPRAGILALLASAHPRPERAASPVLDPGREPGCRRGDPAYSAEQESAALAAGRPRAGAPPGWGPTQPSSPQSSESPAAQPAPRSHMAPDALYGAMMVRSLAAAALATVTAGKSSGQEPEAQALSPLDAATNNALSGGPLSGVVGRGAGQAPASRSPRRPARPASRPRLELELLEARAP